MEEIKKLHSSSQLKYFILLFLIVSIACQDPTFPQEYLANAGFEQGSCANRPDSFTFNGYSPCKQVYT